MFGSIEEFKTAYEKQIASSFEKPIQACTKHEQYNTLVHMICREAAEIRNETSRRHVQNGQKKVFYFSMEFLIGKLLDSYLINLGIRDTVKTGLGELGIQLEDLLNAEPDPGLGNGGLGRLAACFLDSMAATGVAGVGMGLRYHFGLFKQRIENGYQIEEPDDWMSNGYPWDRKKSVGSVIVKYGGRIERGFENGKMTFRHVDYECVRAVPYDIPVIGFGGSDVNVLHLWDAQPVADSVDMDAFNRGDYAQAMRDRAETEAITCILYPDDSSGSGKRLRLKQEYLLVSAGIASIVRKYKADHGTGEWDKMPERISVHINDTHPALCVPELMRVLMDDEGVEWDDAWRITQGVMSFTNHTVLPEALEKWPIDLISKLLPRVYMIIEEIDRRWKNTLQDSGRFDLFRETAILWDGEAKMANLSVIGSHSINGVAALHSKILTESVFHDFYTYFPERFNNKTNGISHRRFLIEANPALTSLITEAIGEKWKSDPSEMEDLLRYTDDTSFLERLDAVKKHNKEKLASFIRMTTDIAVDTGSVFDIQVKRIHAYKRQLLNAVKILNLYNILKENPDYPVRNTTFIFAGKAAQGYAFAKETIKFINSVADTVNSDPVVSEKIKVVFISNFCVSNAQIIYPAADISEQISTAGKEASGTGNMKFMMNGAVTLGTLDGANVEIRDHVGEENMKLFGLRADEAETLNRNGGYNSRMTAESDPRLAAITEQFINGFFKRSGCDFWGIYDALITNNDEYFVLKDFDSYVRAWDELTGVYDDRNSWGRTSLVNIAKSHYFSSDRTIREYADDIWHTVHR